MVASCHRSPLSTSATATLNLFDTRLVIDFNTRLLSLRDALPGRRRLSLHTPIFISGYSPIGGYSSSSRGFLLGLNVTRSVFLVFGMWLIFESGSFGNDSEQGRGGTARTVQSLLPFTDCLLARAQLVGQLPLGQSQVIPQGAYVITVPLLALFCTGTITHGQILHESV